MLFQILRVIEEYRKNTTRLEKVSLLEGRGKDSLEEEEDGHEQIGFG